MKWTCMAALAAGLFWQGAAQAETLVQRGEYLVEGPAACGNCHTSPVPGSAPYAGWEIREAAFTAQAPNITPTSRIAGWSDAEMARAIREGLRPDGTVIGPPMPIGMYRGISDSDLAAMVAYIRTLEPVETDFRASDYPFPLPPSYGPPVGQVAEVPRGVTVEYGAYLAGPVAHCMECHSLTDKGPDLVNNPGGGGFEWHGPWGVSVAANLTSHSDGLAGYSDAEIKAMIISGTRPDGTRMNPPMGYGYYSRIASDDLEAIMMYLRSLPPLPDGD